MANPRTVLNAASIRALGKHPGVRREMTQISGLIRDDIHDSAPIRSGAYSKSWRVEPLPEGGYRVYSTDWKSWLLEKGVRAHGGHPAIPALNLALNAMTKKRR